MNREHERIFIQQFLSSPDALPSVLDRHTDDHSKYTSFHAGERNMSV